MSERISVVVPDGTRERLKKTAKYHKRTQSNCAMRYVLNGLSFEEPLGELRSDGQFQLVPFKKDLKDI